MTRTAWASDFMWTGRPLKDFHDARKVGIGTEILEGASPFFTKTEYSFLAGEVPLNLSPLVQEPSFEILIRLFALAIPDDRGVRGRLCLVWGASNRNPHPDTFPELDECRMVNAGHALKVAVRTPHELLVHKPSEQKNLVVSFPSSPR